MYDKAGPSGPALSYASIKDFAPWAPVEGSAAAEAYLTRLYRFGEGGQCEGH